MGMSLEGKSAIVTGAGGGINLAYTIKLLEAGTNVLIADLNLTQDAEMMVKKYKDKPRVIFKQTDVSSWPDLEAMFNTAQEHFGSVDIVCPGAGIFEPSWSNFWYPPGTTESKDDRTGGRYKSLDINLTHPIRTAQMAISHFLADTTSPGPSNPKRIIFVSSMAGEVAFMAHPLYHASKWALMGFIRSIAGLDDHFGIRSAGVAPGAVMTRIWSEHKDKMNMLTDDGGKVHTPLLTVEDVADAMMALTRDDEVDNGQGETIPIRSGSILEVSGGPIRDIPMLGNTGPKSTDRIRAMNLEQSVKTIVEDLQKPGWGQPGESANAKKIGSPKAVLA